MVIAVNFWDLAMYTKHGLGMQPHLNEPLLHVWRRDFGDVLAIAQVGFETFCLMIGISWPRCDTCSQCFGGLLAIAQV